MHADENIAVVRRYASMAERTPKILPGYSSHDIDRLCSMLAVAAGARMVEKHVTIGNNSFLHFDQVAVRLDTNDFSD
jgi:sialic acid synthase SpsE